MLTRTPMLPRPDNGVVVDFFSQFGAIDAAVPPRAPLDMFLANAQTSPAVTCTETWPRTNRIAVTQAKKRERKTNAAKEPVQVEPAKEVKVVGVDGGKDSPVSKRAGGAGKDKGGRVTVQRSQVLGKKVR